MKKLILFLIAFSIISFTACAESSKSKGTEPMSSTKINVTVNGVTHTATFAENSATAALVEKLKSGSITYQANDYGGFEKVGELPFSLPKSDTYLTSEPGDIFLYLGKSLVIFYGNNSWEYTKIGKIYISDTKELKEFLNAGKGKISIVLSLME